MAAPRNPDTATRQAWIILSICGLIVVAILFLVAAAIERYLSSIADSTKTVVAEETWPRVCNAPAMWITNDDYPPDAIRREEEGTVRIEWTVGGDGRIAACRVVESSGHASLDEAGCRAIKARGCYDRAEAGRTMSRRIVWRLPRD